MLSTEKEAEEPAENMEPFRIVARLRLKETLVKFLVKRALPSLSSVSTVRSIESSSAAMKKLVMKLMVPVRSFRAMTFSKPVSVVARPATNKGLNVANSIATPSPSPSPT